MCRENAEEKKAEAARKKAEREALLAEEEKNTPGRSAPKNAKSAVKKTKGLDQALGQLDNDAPLPTLNASGIENAIDALGLTDSKPSLKIDRHPERRQWKYDEWKLRRLKEMEANDPDWEQKKKYRNALSESLWKEWKNSPENPTNQVHAAYNSTQEDIAQIRAQMSKDTEKRLASK
ncbi:hypothetical protein M406DRAFT_252363 [Cryphonectria parasitica EP155]|uniref:Coiled-coil domain-containing protein n=1 Tax=Cryphonectria parasitica (strain ATCC 38755 / EP155) TaxID=660469 RepID=A0A9P4Y8L1_CRYP1|nr:uncharacterized protein M406DRAFT_252363 [Cryphonectria parasitica EP155]KAF3768060.1 hypothetical protein M406DRAFT_252363 [Cryphonectria parasitica EP155]